MLLHPAFVAVLAVLPPPGDAIAPLVGERIEVVDRDRAPRVRNERTPPVGLPPRLVGTLAAYDGRTLTITSGNSRWEIPREQVKRLRVSRGGHSQWATGARVGAGIVGAFGLAAGLACAEVCGDGEGTGGAGVVAGTAIGALIGGTLGAALGAPFRGDRWEKVPLSDAPVQLSLVPVTRGVGIRFTVRRRQ